MTASQQREILRASSKMKHAKLYRDLRKERIKSMKFKKLYMTIILLALGLGSAQKAPINMNLELQHNCLVCLSW